MPRDETASKLEIVTEIPDKAMVIFAHPDDAEIGSGGVAAKWAAAGCEVTYVLCTNGAAGTADRTLTPAALARKRADEQRAAADFMGVRHVVMTLGDQGAYRYDAATAGGKRIPGVRVPVSPPERLLQDLKNDLVPMRLRLESVLQAYTPGSNHLKDLMVLDLVPRLRELCQRLGRAPRRVEKGSGVIFRLLKPTRSKTG